MSGKILGGNVSKQCHLMVLFRIGTCGVPPMENIVCTWLGSVTFLNGHLLCF